MPIIRKKSISNCWHLITQRVSNKWLCSPGGQPSSSAENSAFVRPHRIMHILCTNKSGGLPLPTAEKLAFAPSHRIVQLNNTARSKSMHVFFGREVVTFGWKLDHHPSHRIVPLNNTTNLKSMHVFIWRSAVTVASRRQQAARWTHAYL